MLYEPTNIIPSTFTQTGTVAQNDNVNIQWQVNGNSALNMFQIDVMQNNVDSTFVYSSGIIDNSDNENLPFYGKNRLGDYVPFTYTPSVSWYAWSNNQITDGNTYKFTIVQFYTDSNVIFKINLETTSVATSYYFTYVYNGTTYYVSFPALSSTIMQDNSVIYYSHTYQTGWIRQTTNNQRIEYNITFSRAQIQPTSGQSLGAAALVTNSDIFYNQFFTIQNAPSAFITRTQPSLTLNTFTMPVTSASQSFSAQYSQAQGDSISNVRWQLFNNTSLNTPIDDTGIIYTPILNYEYNGLFDSQTYIVQCTVETQNGIQVTTSQTFAVSYSLGQYQGEFQTQILRNSDATLLSWDAVSNIPGVNTPANSATVSQGYVYLPANSTITWSQQSNSDNELESINFSSPWTALWSGTIEQETVPQYIQDVEAQGVPLNSMAYNVAFNPTGTLAVVVGAFTNRAMVFAVNNNNFTYLSTLQLNGSNFIANVLVATFSPDGSLLVLGGNFVGHAAVYTVNGQTVTYATTITKNGTTFDSPINSIVFLSNRTAIMGGQYAPETGVATFNVSGNNVTVAYQTIQMENFGAVNGIAYNLQNNLIVITQTNSSSSRKGGAFIYSVSGTTINYISALEDLSTCQAPAFNSSGTLFVLSKPQYAGPTTISLYTVSNNQFVLATTSAPGYSFGDFITFTPSQDQILTNYSRGAYFYQINYNNGVYSLTQGEEITKNGNSIAPNASSVLNGIYSPLNNLLVFVGSFPGYAGLWNVTIPILAIDNLFTITNNVTVSRNNQSIVIKNSALSQTLATVNILNYADYVTVEITPTQAKIYCFKAGQYLGQTSANLSYNQTNVSAAEIEGPQTCNYFSIIDGNGSAIEEYLTDYQFVPSWNNNSGYTVDLLANFLQGIDGGTGTSTGNGYRIYRQNTKTNEYLEIATLPSTILNLKDYSIKSGESYSYNLYVYDANGAFMGVKTSALPICKRFNQFSLLSTQYNTTDYCYHVIKEYQFSCNVQDMTISNNSNKSYSQNFTPYPTVFKSSANYASGTLQALIGFIDKQAYEYWDSTQLMEELNGLSTTNNTLFLKDMKGHLWMVDVGTVQQTANQKTNQMQVTISLPWTEIGSADDVSIIQTPEDEGWDYDAQVLDVQLDVDVNSGLLQVVYPFPYNGTAFYLVGVTPQGTTTTIQQLPVNLTNSTDGQLTATVRSK